MPGAIIAIVIVACIAVKWRLDAKFRPQYVADLVEGRRCVWCKRPIEASDATPDRTRAGRGSAHLKCEMHAAKRHLFYYRAFLGMAIMGAVCFIGGTVSDCVAAHKIIWGEIAMFSAPLIAVFWLPLVIRSVAVPWVRSLESQQSEGAGARRIGM